MTTKRISICTLYFSAAAALLALNSVAHANSERMQWAITKHFYQRYDQPLTWHGAQEQCKSQGAHLVTITSEAERNFINNNIYKDRSFWIGASDAAVNNHFAWVTGEKWLYQNWSAAPHNTKAADYVWASPFEWSTNKSSDMNIYVCEWSTHNYIGVASIPDFNGNGVDEAAVLYIDYVTQKHVVKIRDLKTDTVITTLTFRSGSKAPKGFVVLNDTNGNHAPEIGVLYSEIGGVYSEFGQPAVDIKDVKNNKLLLKTINFLDSRFAPKEISVVSDMNHNGTNEIAVLSMGKSNNVPTIEIRDSKTGKLLADTKF